MDSQLGCKEHMNQYRGLVMKAVPSSNVPAIPVSISDFSKVSFKLRYHLQQKEQNSSNFHNLLILQKRFKHLFRYAAVPGTRRSTMLLATIYGFFCVKTRTKHEGSSKSFRTFIFSRETVTGVVVIGCV